MKWTAQATGYAMSTSIGPIRRPKSDGGGRWFMLDRGSRSVINCFQFCAAVYRGAIVDLLGARNNRRVSRLRSAGGLRKRNKGLDMNTEVDTEGWNG